MKDGLFSPAAEDLAGDASVLNLYEIFLGREPESSFVIQEAKFQSIRSLFRSFVQSEEFVEEVVWPIQEHRRIRHELMSPGPTPWQCMWIASFLSLSPADDERIRIAKSWPDFFEELLRVVGNVPVTEELEAAGNVDQESASEHTHTTSTAKFSSAGAQVYWRMLERIAIIEEQVNELKLILAEMTRSCEV